MLPNLHGHQEKEGEEEGKGRRQGRGGGGRAHGRVWLNLVLCCHGRDALSALCKVHGYTA